MNIQNQKGEIITAVAVTLAIIFGLVFIPNDLSKATGLQNKQNKLVQTKTEKIELLKDEDGQPIRSAEGGYLVKRMENTSDKDEQQQVTLWERVVALPFVLMLLCGLGVAFPFIGAHLLVLYRALKRELLSFKKDSGRIVKGIDQAFATIPLTLAGENLPGEIDRAALARKIQENMLTALSRNYDQSTKDLVKTLR